MPMRLPCTAVCRALLAGTAALVLAATPVSAQTCDPGTFDVLNKTFQRLSAPAKPWNASLANAFVWVDNINSRIFGGYEPFDVYILVGRIYPPFSSNNGRLTRDAFLRLSDAKKDLNNNRTGPIRVPATFTGEQRLAPAFAIGKGRFFLRAVRMQLQRMGDNERIVLRVCQEP
jgi:hypothetical protein